MFQAAFKAVSTVLISVLVGAFTCSMVPYTQTSIKDFTYLITTVLQPALIVTNMGDSVSVKMLEECVVLLILDLFFISVGLVWGYFFPRFLRSHLPSNQNACLPLSYRDRVSIRLRYECRRVHDEESEERASAHDSGSFPAGESVELQKESVLPSSPFASSVLDFASPTSMASPSSSMPEKCVKVPYVELKWRAAVSAGEVESVVAQLHPPEPSADLLASIGWISFIAFSMLNTVTLPLSLLDSLCQDLSWLNFEEASAYVFVYSMPAIVYVWGLGPYFVQRGKKKVKEQSCFRRLLEEHRVRQHLVDVGTQTSEREELWEEVTRAPYAWETAGLVRSVVVEGDEAAGADEDEDEDRNPMEMVQRVARSGRKLLHRLLLNPPLIAIFVGSVVGAVPFLKSLFFGPGAVFSVITDALNIIAAGSIPACLLMLGMNLTGGGRKSKTGEEGESARRNANAPAGLPDGIAHVYGGIERSENIRKPLQKFLRDASTSAVAPVPVVSCHPPADTPPISEGETSIDPSESSSPLGPECFVRCSYDESGKKQLVYPERSVLAHSSSTGIAFGASREVTTAASVESTVVVPAGGVEEGSTWEQWKSKIGRVSWFGGLHPTFVLGVVVARLLLIPSISFLIMISFSKIFPFMFGGRGKEDLSMIMTVFVEVGAPTAINSGILFASQEFMVEQWIKMLFLQYVLSIGSTVFWTWLGLKFTETLLPPPLS